MNQKHGLISDWNNLHTHVGSTWSGIYYVQLPSSSLLPFSESQDSSAYIGRENSKRNNNINSDNKCIGNGHLLLKPTPHISEKNVGLSAIDIFRLNCCCDKTELESRFISIEDTVVELPSNDSFTFNNNNNNNRKKPFDFTAPTLSCCDYIEINPKAGIMYVIPSWLQHAVLPLSVEPGFRNEPQGARISVAFNYQQA